MFVNKTVIDLQQKKEKGKYAGAYEEIEILEHSPRLFVEMVTEGPCEVKFNRVYSDKGLRTMKCIKPEIPSSQNAFDPRFPTLIAVIDLDLGDWRSFYYEQVYSIKRMFKYNLTSYQRRVAAVLRGEDWDYFYPGPEGYSLRAEDYDSFSEFRKSVMPKTRMPR
jgi:hypothetical protein